MTRFSGHHRPIEIGPCASGRTEQQQSIRISRSGINRSHGIVVGIMGRPNNIIFVIVGRQNPTLRDYSVSSSESSSSVVSSSVEGSPSTCIFSTEWVASSTVEPSAKGTSIRHNLESGVMTEKNNAAYTVVQWGREGVFITRPGTLGRWDVDRIL